MYLFGYGVGRFWVESLRTDQLLIPGLGIPVSMVVGASMAVVSAVWIIVIRQKVARSGENAQIDDIRDDEGQSGADASAGAGTEKTE